MQGLILFALCVVAACWVLVVGHQLGWEAVDPTKNEFLEAAMAFSYVCVGASLSFVVAVTVTSLVRKE